MKEPSSITLIFTRLLRLSALAVVVTVMLAYDSVRAENAAKPTPEAAAKAVDDAARRVVEKTIDVW